MNNLKLVQNSTDRVIFEDGGNLRKIRGELPMTVFMEDDFYLTAYNGNSSTVVCLSLDDLRRLRMFLNEVLT